MLPNFLKSAGRADLCKPPMDGLCWGAIGKSRGLEEKGGKEEGKWEREEDEDGGGEAGEVWNEW